MVGDNRKKYYRKLCWVDFSLLHEKRDFNKNNFGFYFVENVPEMFSNELKLNKQDKCGIDVINTFGHAEAFCRLL